MSEPSDADRWEYWTWDSGSTYTRDEDPYDVPGLGDGLRTWEDVYNAAGAQGWELVTVTLHPRGYTLASIHIFKRRLP